MSAKACKFSKLQAVALLIFYSSQNLRHKRASDTPPLVGAASATASAQHPLSHSFSLCGYLAVEPPLLCCACVLCIILLDFFVLTMGPAKVSTKDSADLINKQIGL